MTHMRMPAVLLLCLSTTFAGCTDAKEQAEHDAMIARQAVMEFQQSEQRRLDSVRIETARQDSIRLAAQRLEEERLARLAAERDAAARSFASTAGAGIMESVGGGQDLIVMTRDWRFDEVSQEFEIAMEVSFNGAIVRGNNYRVSGVLTTDATGGNARFARLEANPNYLRAEDRVAAIAVTAAGLLVLGYVGSQK